MYRMENEFITLEMDENGILQELRNRKTDRNLLHPHQLLRLILGDSGCLELDAVPALRGRKSCRAPSPKAEQAARRLQPPRRGAARHAVARSAAQATLHCFYPAAEGTDHEEKRLCSAQKPDFSRNVLQKRIIQ